MYKNIISALSFPFIIQKVRMGRTNKRVEDGWVCIRTGTEERISAETLSAFIVLFFHVTGTEPPQGIESS